MLDSEPGPKKGAQGRRKEGPPKSAQKAANEMGKLLINPSLRSIQSPKNRKQNTQRSGSAQKKQYKTSPVGKRLPTPLPAKPSELSENVSIEIITSNPSRPSKKSGPLALMDSTQPLPSVNLNKRSKVIEKLKELTEQHRTKLA